jgi:hypothetical protein
VNQEPFGWYDVLPRSLAISQIAWERYQCAVRMRDLGLTYDQIGTRLNVSRERARQMVKAGIRRKRPPVWNYFLGTTELVREAYLLDQRRFSEESLRRALAQADERTRRALCRQLAPPAPGVPRAPGP